MALWQAISCSLAVLSLISQSFSGSGGGIESGQEYLVVPELADCPMNTTCDTMSSYSKIGTTGVYDVIFSFLPGIHKLSQTWNISDSSNITIRGEGHSAEDNNEPSYVVDVECESNFSGQHAIEVKRSNRVVIQGIRIVTCSSSLFLEATNGTTVLDISIIPSFYNHAGLSASDCEDIVIKHSNFSNCNYAISFDNIQRGVIDDIVAISNQYGLYLNGFLDIEVSKSYFMNNWFSSIQASISQGNISLKQIFSEGSTYPLQVYPVELVSVDGTSARVSISDSTVRMEDKSFCGIYIYTGLLNMDISLQSVSVTGTSGSGLNGIIIQNFPDEGSLAERGSVRIDNVTIENISTGLSEHTSFFTPSALAVVSSKNLTISDCTIKNNGVTGILLYDSTAILQGKVILSNNSGINGGGMSLVSNSFIVLKSFTNLQLSDNRADKFGGGIYVSQTVQFVEPYYIHSTFFTYCFVFSFDPTSEAYIEFNGNRANRSGQDLYGGYVDGCLLPTYNNQETYDILGHVLQNVSDNCSQTVISSDPIKILSCTEYCVDESEHHTNDKWALFPGQDFSFRIAAVGQRNGLTPAIILISSDDIILDETSPDMTQSFDTRIIDAQCTTVTQTLALREYVHETVVYFTIADESLPSYVNTPIQGYIEVLPCPPGFNLSAGICGCSISIQNLATCNITSESIQRNGNSWIYPQNDSIMIFNNCPFDYCNNNTFPSDNPDEQCDLFRSGILCGACIPEYSLVLGSNECKNCTEQVWQLPLIVLGCFLAGIGLVAVLIAMNLTVSVGTMNGLIFFVNIVKIYEPIFVPDKLHPIIHYFISWLNLDLGITSCFIPGMMACDKVGLQFVFPLYLLSIVAFIIVICKAGQWPVLSSSRIVRFVSGKVTLLIGSKAIPVLATLLLLSYTKLLRTTILIIHKATIITIALATDCDEETSFSACEDFTVWYVDGTITYASKCHGTLLSLAVGISMPLVVLFPSFLLFFPLMERYLPRFKCWSSWHMRLKPWYDAYGGPYKDKYRSWSGMLLLVRYVLALVVSFKNDLLVNRSVLAWTCLFLISLLSLFQVYQNFFLNSLELLYLACLLLMVFLSTTAGQIDAVLSVVMCSFLFIISYHFYHQLVKLDRIHHLINKVKKKIMNFGNNFRKESITHTRDAKDSTDSSTLVTMKSVQYSDLREPLLEEEL